MPRFLSPEWVKAIGQAATASPLVREATGRMAFTIGHVVTNGPDGTVFYWMRLADGRVETGVGNEAEVAADVTFTHDYATAASLSRGEFTLQEAAFAGRVKVTGRPEALLTSVAATTWIELAAALAPVQAATTY